MATKGTKLTEGDYKGIYQRASDGLFVAPFFVDSKRKVIYGVNKDDAARKRLEALKKVEKGQITAESHQTVERHVKEWLEEYRGRNLSPRSVAFVERLFLQFVVPVIGRKRLEEVSRSHLQAMVNRWHTLDKLSPTTIQQYFSYVKTIFRIAIRDDKLRKNPCEGVIMPRKRRFQTNVPSRYVLNSILARAQEERGLISTMLPLLLTTGLRRGELLGLHWSDIDMEKGTFHVRRSVNYANGALVASATKTEEGEREVFLTSIGIEALKKQWATNLKRRLRTGKEWKEHDVVFCSPKGTYLNPSSVRDHLNRFLKKYGFPHMRVHDTRHAAATVLLSLGVKVNMVQDFLGHTDPHMTLGIYGHVTEEDVTMAREIMEQAYAPSQQRRKSGNV